MKSGRAPDTCGVVMMSKSPPCVPVPTATCFLGPKLAPASVDFQTPGLSVPLSAAPKIQLCESTQSLGSAPLPLAELIGLRFAAKVAGPGGDGGLYALGPPVCFVYQVFA